MVLTFVISVGEMFTHVQPVVLFNLSDDNASDLPYALAALPYLLTSFGYHGNIPGLVKYYPKDIGAVVCSLLYGTSAGVGDLHPVAVCGSGQYRT